MNNGIRTKLEDPQQVAVLFLDPQIRALFADLLAARGLPVAELSSPAEFEGETRIITEPIYLPLLPAGFAGKCLVVGNAEADHNGSAVYVARPLTEEKIEKALQRFLS